MKCFFYLSLDMTLFRNWSPEAGGSLEVVIKLLLRCFMEDNAEQSISWKKKLYMVTKILEINWLYFYVKWIPFFKDMFLLCKGTSTNHVDRLGGGRGLVKYPHKST